MNENIERPNDYYVKIMEAESYRFWEDIGDDAFKLFFYYHGRIEEEFQCDGFRAGAILGFPKKSDESVAADLRGRGLNWSHDKVCRCRNKLASKGIVAQYRTPWGYRVLVMHSIKFPSRCASDLPAIAVRAVAVAQQLYKRWRRQLAITRR